MSFALTGRESILIYGAGEQGREFVRLFKDNGFPVKAVLDKGAEEIKRITVGGYEVCVVDPEHYDVSSQDEIVVISLWNALRHEKIALYLWEKGFQRIIYVPMSITGNSKLVSLMRRSFNEILGGNLRIVNLPEYSDIRKEIKRNEDADIVYLPIELLFSEEEFEIPTEQLSGAAYRKRKNVLKSAGENLMNFKSYYQMYDYLDRAQVDCSDYFYTQIDETAVNFEEEKKRILRDRYELFQIYEKAFELDRDFFIDSAPRAIWNPKGYFNINDGHHRVSYLFYKGIRDIPVRVGEEEKAQLKIFDQISASFFCELPALIHAKNSLFWRKKNEKICASLLKKEALGKQIYINMDDAGYISRYCCRMGCKKCIDIESGEKVDFAKQMCELFQYQDRINISGNVEGEIYVDIAVIDEKCLVYDKEVHADIYVLVMEERGSLYDSIIKKGIPFERLDKIFSGEQEYLIVRIKGGGVCFL